MQKKHKIISLLSEDDVPSRDVSMSVDPDSDVFDIDDDSDAPKKKILRKKLTRNTHTKSNGKKASKSTFSDSSDDNLSDAFGSEQSLISIEASSSESLPQNTKRCALQRLKDETHGIKRKRNDSDDDYDACDFTDNHNNIQAAWKCTNDEYDSDALHTFYRETLGIESDSCSESKDEIEIITEPLAKRQKLDPIMDRNKFKSKLAETQLKESFASLPLSQDVMNKIARYLTIIEVSRILVLINREFCAYFNTDSYWEKLYCALSKRVMNKEQIKVIKSYTLACKKCNKLYKRRILWYFTTIIAEDVDYNAFNVLLLKYMEADHDRLFAVKLYLVKECAVMHYNKQHGIEVNKQGIYEAYRMRDEDMNVIMPFNDRHIPKKYKHFQRLHLKFEEKWKTQTDILDTFRFVNQVYVEYVLNAMVTENVEDLAYLVKLHTFYEGALGNACNVITRLISDCDDSSGIHAMLDWDAVENDVVNVTIQSPTIVLHQQLIHIMQFINGYNDNNELHCKLSRVKHEFLERKIIAKEDDFANIKALIDLKQFQLSKKYITCKCRI